MAVVRVGVGEALGQVGQHLQADARGRHQHGLELTGVEDEHLHVGLGHDVRRADPSVQQCQLAEVAPGSELRHLTLPDAARRDPHEHEEELTADRALFGQDRALLHIDVGAELGDGPKLALRAPGEEWHFFQEVDLLLGNPMPHLATCPGFELFGNARWSVLPHPPSAGSLGW